MGDKSPIILTQRKKRKLAKAKEEMLARFQWAIDKAEDAVESHDNKNNNNTNTTTTTPMTTKAPEKALLNYLHH